MVGYVIDIVDVPPSPLAVARGSATTWEEFRSAWKPMLDGVWTFLRQNDLRTDGHNVMVYRNDVPQLDFEVGVQVAGSFEAAGAVVPSALPAGRAAHTVHRGDYAGLGDAHDSVLSWCRANGQVTTSVRWEVYGDWDDDPAKIQTDVYWLLQGLSVRSTISRPVAGAVTSRVFRRRLRRYARRGSRARHRQPVAYISFVTPGILLLTSGGLRPRPDHSPEPRTGGRSPFRSRCR